MKLIIICILLFNVQLLFAQHIPDSIRSKIDFKTMDFKEENEKELHSYIDSINSYTKGPLPNFLADECFDWRSYLWNGLHSPVSLRWIILTKVSNKKALKAILDRNDKRLKQVCGRKHDKVYPYLSVPMIEMSFYQLIQKRYKQLKS